MLKSEIGTFHAQSLGDQLPAMRLWAMDAWVFHSPVLTDQDLLREVMYEAAQGGGMTVLGEEFCAFDNGAVTGVLVLAQSHLSIHTWPEYDLANVDLLSYGRVRGDEVMREMALRLDARSVTIKSLLRAVR